MSDRLFGIWVTIGFIGCFAGLVAICVAAAIDLWPWGALCLLIPAWAGVAIFYLVNDTIQVAIHNDILWKNRR